MNNDTVKLLDVLDLIVNIDVAIIPYEKVREYVDAVRLYLIKKVRELPVNEGELNLQELYATSIDHIENIKNASNVDGKYNEGFFDGLQFSLDFFKFLKNSNESK